MSSRKTLVGVLVDEHDLISFQEMCELFQVSEAVFSEMAEYGVLSFPEKDWHDAQFDYQAVLKVRSAQRLQHDLGVNLPGVAVIFELLQELEETQSQLQILRRHVETL